MQRRPLECFVDPINIPSLLPPWVLNRRKVIVIWGNSDPFDQFAGAFLMPLMSLSPLPLDKDGQEAPQVEIRPQAIQEAHFCFFVALPEHKV